MQFILSVFSQLIFLTQDTMAVDTTGLGYKVGVYIGSSLPFIGLLLVFLLIIRKSYRFRSKK
jgi:ABC-type uncharacterized transport system permease subunit